MADKQADLTTTKGWLLYAIDRLGFPTIIVIALGWGGYQGVVWFGNEVAKPVVQKHLQYLESQEDYMEIQAENAKQQTENTESMIEVQKKNADTLITVLEMVENQSQLTSEQHKLISELCALVRSVVQKE